MTTLNLPLTTFTLQGTGSSIVENAPQKVLFLGEQITDQSPNEVLITNIGINGEEDELFGTKSMLAYMIRQFRALNQTTRVDAIPFNPNGGSNYASGAIAISGSATENGSLEVVVQSRQLYRFQIPIVIGDGPDEVGNAIVSAINGSDTILVGSSYINPTVNLDSLISGTEGNSIGLEIEATTIPAGLSFILNGFASGAVNPIIVTATLDQVQNIRYQTVIAPASWTQTNLLAFMNSRFNPTDRILDGVVILGSTDTEANLEAFSLTLDSQSYVLLGNKPVSVLNLYEGSALFESDFAIASQFAAIRALRLTQGQNISGLLTGGANSGNVLGGPRLAAIPYHNTPFANLPLIESQYGWTLTEQDDLNNNGVAFLGNNPQVSGIISGDIVTTYQTGTEPWKYLNTVDTGSQIREFFATNNQQNYSQSIMTQGDLVPNSNQVNISSYIGYQKQLYTTLATDPNYALCPLGDAALNAFVSNLQVTFTFETGTITEFAVVPIVSQIRVINGVIQISFDVSTT